MPSPQPSGPGPADPAEALSPSHIRNDLAAHRTDKTIVWEELPKSTSVKCLADSNIQWTELPRVNPEATRYMPSAGVSTKMSSCSLTQKTEAEWTDMSQRHSVTWSTLLETCPTVTTVVGMPSREPVKEPHWPSKPVWEKQLKPEEPVQLPKLKEDDRNSKQMVGLTQTCPREARSPGFPSVKDYTSSSNGSQMLDICPKLSKIPGFPSTFEDSDRRWVLREEPILEKQIKSEELIIVPGEAKEDIKQMGALLPSCPNRSGISGIPSFLQPSTAHVIGQDLFNALHLLPSCPSSSRVAGCLSMQLTVRNEWNANREVIWEKGTKTDFLPLPENINMDKTLTGLGSLSSAIWGLPSMCHPDMVSLKTMCSNVSQVAGLPSYHGSGEWKVSQSPIAERGTRERQLWLTDRGGRDERALREMLSLSASCPQVARAPGFPSRPTPSIVSLRTMCSQSSKLPGLHSFAVAECVEWAAQSCSLMKQLPQKAIIVVSPLSGKQKDMSSFVPSCPKKSSIHGFPSIPNPRQRCPPLNAVTVLHMCPKVSVIPGCPSVDSCGKGGWVTEPSSVSFPPPKKTECRIYSSPSLCVVRMYALAPSCPRSSKTPGFPSVPAYSMLTLLPAWPKASLIPGCGSEGYEQCRWHSQTLTLFDRPIKTPLFIIYPPDQCGDSVKNMFRLAPCCPEASRLSGFPSQPQSSPRVTFPVSSLVHCCSSASRIEGFGCTASGTGWANLASAVVLLPQDKKAEMLAPFAGQWRNQEYGYSMKQMASECPKETRLHGVPSAPSVNRPPNMVSLYTSGSSSSCIPGLPSTRLLSAACVNMQTNEEQGNTLFQRPQKEKTFDTTQFQSVLEHQLEEGMAAMVSSCPHLTRNPGFPSTSHRPSDSQPTPLPNVPTSKSPSQTLGETLKDKSVLHLLVPHVLLCTLCSWQRVVKQSSTQSCMWRRGK